LTPKHPSIIVYYIFCIYYTVYNYGNINMVYILYTVYIYIQYVYIYIISGISIDSDGISNE